MLSNKKINTLTDQEAFSIFKYISEFVILVIYIFLNIWLFYFFALLCFYMETELSAFNSDVKISHVN